MEFFDPERKQVMTSDEFILQCTRLVLLHVVLKIHEAAAEGLGEYHEDEPADEILSVIDARRLRACVSRAPKFGAVVMGVFTIIAASVVEMYRRQLDGKKGENQADLSVSGPFLQDLFGGEVSEHVTSELKNTLTSQHGQPLIRTGLPFLMPGGSVPALAMHLASHQWHYALSIHGVPAVNHLAQGGLQAHAVHKRDLTDACAWAAAFASRRQEAAWWLMSRSESKAELEELQAEVQASDDRNRVIAISAWQKVLSVVTNDRGVWAPASVANADTGPLTHWRLDATEDASRRRRRLVRNPNGSSHPEASQVLFNMLTTLIFLNRLH